jgi:carbonic anhydrase/acetyltransferase-like protein (isoleucine patch superfamily)
MAFLHRFGNHEPQVASDAFIAPTATLIGDVVVEEGASVWFGTVLRGDYNRIVVGSGATVQDNCVIHSNEERPTKIGSNVTVGRFSILEACTIEDGAILGMGSIVLHRSKVGTQAILAAGTVVREGQEIPPGVLAAGTPAEVKESLKGSAAGRVETAALKPQSLRVKYIQQFMARE